MAYDDHRPPRRRWHLALLILPFLWQIGGIPFVNDVTVRPFGLPFPMLWQIVGILFASAVIAFVRSIDRRRESLPDDPA
jgi:hypothetical protein